MKRIVSFLMILICAAFMRVSAFSEFSDILGLNATE